MLVSRPNSVDQLVKTPTPVYGTEGRYAAALYSAASKNKALEAVEKDLKTMTATLGKDAQFAAFLADPSGKVHHILAAKGANLRIYVSLLRKAKYIYFELARDVCLVLSTF